MKQPCPYCRKEIDLMELLHDSDQLAIIKMLNTFGKHSNLVCAYTEIFGIRPIKSKVKKWRVLLEELKRLFDSESFTYQKRLYPISQAGIVEALNIVVHRNFTDGLDSHNYLKKIMITISEREYQDKSRQGEKDLRKREGVIMSSGRPAEKSLTREVNRITYPLPEEQVEPPVTQLTEAQRQANIERVGNLLKGFK